MKVNAAIIIILIIYLLKQINQFAFNQTTQKKNKLIFFFISFHYIKRVMSIKGRFSETVQLKKLFKLWKMSTNINLQQTDIILVFSHIVLNT